MEIQALSPEIIQDTDDSIPADLITSTFSSTCIDLISAPLGSRILSTSDEWFAPATNLLTPTAPIRRPGVYVASGAWYDGWETRRHNRAPFDWVVVKLGVASGRVRGVEIDTAFFDGNHAEAIAVQACFEPGPDADERVSDSGYGGWVQLLGRRACGPSRRQAWKVSPTSISSSASASERAETPPVTHVRLLMFPDGGIARFRLYGEAIPLFGARGDEEMELSAAVMGGLAVSCSDQHFGTSGNLLLPGRGVDMGDGWETRRSRAPGHEDWVVVKLGARGLLSRLVVDTAHFRGNFPRAVKVEGKDVVVGEKGHRGLLLLPSSSSESSESEGPWVEVLGTSELGPDREHEFGQDVLENVVGRAFTHVKMTIIPDGGVKRFRVFGTVAAGG